MLNPRKAIQTAAKALVLIGGAMLLSSAYAWDPIAGGFATLVVGGLLFAVARPYADTYFEARYRESLNDKMGQHAKLWKMIDEARDTTAAQVKQDEAMYAELTDVRRQLANCRGEQDRLSKTQQDMSETRLGQGPSPYQPRRVSR